MPAAGTRDGTAAGAAQAEACGGLAVLGGSFNPPHIGHLRLAIEVRELLGKRARGVDLVPCAVPPHKRAASLLPFELRAAMLEAALADLPDLNCNRLEGRRPGPSYTWDTLCAYRREQPATELYFVLGSPNLPLLPTWRNGLALPELCHLLVVPREGQDAAFFAATARRLWPAARERAPLLPGCPSLELPGGGLAIFAPLPWLDVSASRVRRLWLAGRRPDFLVPPVVLRMLRAARPLVLEHWQEKD
ncbi:nicotinate-nicotinamide nucleotide adenylyltransferase [Desulfovibrio legallii]|uniref:Probable nicotinate-nucleotide adenylyltransferase n=1 Tax=Desulfovibrio legallii TaxID=571438 RepID=A0A1G7M596_9BACT|nr:nicotinate-nicotinamide nucleotide adenylyltransferase [Desulfovibrio legallii]SDF56881.1 nicotinate-nucleotide adenylyltransferase [Desulfovibrio legallii]